MRDSVSDSGGSAAAGPVRLFFAALWLSLFGVAASMVAVVIEAFPLRAILMAVAIVAVAAAGACIGAGTKRRDDGRTEAA